MKKVQKAAVCIVVASAAFYAVFMFYVQSVIAGENKCLDWLASHKCLDYDGGVQTTLIDYDLLSNEYKALFTKEEFENASSGDELYDIYTKVNSIDPKLKKNDMYITGWKNYLAGVLHTSHGDYHIEYDIWFRVTPFTSNTEIVRWEVDIKAMS